MLHYLTNKCVFNYQVIVHPASYTAHANIPRISLSQIEVLNKHLFLTSKPVIYLVNLSEKDFIRKKNKW